MPSTITAFAKWWFTISNILSTFSNWNSTKKGLSIYSTGRIIHYYRYFIVQIVLDFPIRSFFFKFSFVFFQLSPTALCTFPYFLASQDVPAHLELYIPPSPKIRQFSKEPDSFYWRILFGNQYLGFRCAHYYWESLFLRPLKGPRLGNVYMSSHTLTHIFIYMYPSLY